MGRASVLVNGGGYGFPERQVYAAYIERYLSDIVDVPEEKAFDVNYRGGVYHVEIDFTAQKP